MADEFDRWRNQKAMTGCKSCLFWRALSPDGEGVKADGNYDVNDDGVGRCRRYPPAGNDAHDAALWAEWPLTTDEDWCGEHSEGTQGAR